jgi:hypothetical protein
LIKDYVLSRKLLLNPLVLNTGESKKGRSQRPWPRAPQTNRQAELVPLGVVAGCTIGEIFKIGL